ncbi:rhomboid family intramembrane serine protease [Polaribacter sp. HL-MS24]|uniref:rhomboid family intramembrane serine protease n=1 Tax=Polaribacter sp. HL-MS24 TaxID=3077735 RepID=UPI00293508D2|nr:rhomboid family intramembrane serine protease [Polaribacter sp. HL-MS24]WOC40350.1 rhomboid family intramembrane serine protease [Polaribacter sp. HL-MS24]
MSLIDNLQQKYKESNTLEKLIYLHVGVFLFSIFFDVVQGLYNGQTNWLIQWFSLDSSTDTFLSKPWSIVSYGFLHADFIHLLMNMIVLYYIGNLFVEYFTQKQLLTFYLLGTIFGGLLFIVSHNYFPFFEGRQSVLVGASAGISAIFIGITTHMPNYQLKLRFIGFVKLWYLAGFWILLDFIGLTGDNAGGHFAHLGGALFGYVYISQASNKSGGMLNLLWAIFQKKDKPLRTVYKSDKKKKKTARNTSFNQKQIDTILDKISKSGYDTLSKAEKDFLFKQGKQ